MQRVAQGGVGQQRVKTGHNAIQLRSNVQDEGHDLAHLAHDSDLHTTTNGIADGNHVQRIVSQYQVNLDIAQQVAGQLST